MNHRKNLLNEPISDEAWDRVQKIMALAESSPEAFDLIVRTGVLSLALEADEPEKLAEAIKRVRDRFFGNESEPCLYSSYLAPSPIGLQ